MPWYDLSPEHVQLLRGWLTDLKRGIKKVDAERPELAERGMAILAQVDQVLDVLTTAPLPERGQLKPAVAESLPMRLTRPSTAPEGNGDDGNKTSSN